MPSNIEPEDQSTKPDIPIMLDHLMSWIEQRKVVAQVPLEKTGQPWNWVMGLVMVVAVVIGVAIMAWRAWAQGKEIAKLKHQLDVDIEAKRQAEISAQLDEHVEYREALNDTAQSLVDKINKTRDAIVKLEAERRSIHTKLNRATSWEDVDAIVEQVHNDSKFSS